MARRTRPNDHDWWDKFWKDRSGEVVVWQRPNVLLISWIVLTFISLFIEGRAADVLWYVALAALAIWSLLEITRGVNYLRRTVGAVVLLLVIVAALRLA
jgi:hypothetical protein